MTLVESSVRVFGGIGVDGLDGPVSIGGPRQRRLLALLVVRLEVVATNDWLAEHLWNDEDRPKATAPAIRTYMSRLRQALPAEAQEWIETESSGYRWVGPVDVVEHRRFALLRSAATQARHGEDPQTALSLLDEALGLWRGDPFRELEDLDWARAEIEQLRLDRLEMQEERWEAALALGRHTQITGELAAFTAEHRLRDRSARQYALALHRSGRTTEALRAIAAHRETLAEESGLDPSPDVVELEAALLAGDTSLDVEKVGRPLRGYRLLEEIGSGAFSVVWRGIQPSVDREVAIKEIRSDLASQPEFIRRFEAEAHLIARIEHPYIVPLIDYWRDPDSAYLVMRWLRGGTLERALDDGPLTVAQTLTVARQIGGALAAAHAQGVVHRDVKTSNILCDEQQNAFLADFGIALEATKSSGPEAALSPGSPAYASPEQIRQERLDAPADLFSLGVVLYECLAGELPFPTSSSVAELVELQLNTPYPSLAELRSDVPIAMSAAIAKATAKDPEDRYASVDEFLDALDADSADSPPDVAIATLVDAANPYKGLRAFDSGDTARFFGRERLVTELTDRLDGTGVSSRCLVIVGPSGSGKSSVARAGLVPAIRAGAVAGSDDWFVTTMSPATDPYEALEAALLRIAVNPPPSLIEQLRSGPRGIVRGLRRCLTSDDDQVLVVVDQFEELFTTATPQDAEDFLSALSVAVEDPTSPLRLVATLRADFYDRPLAHGAFAQIVKQSTVQVTPLAADELERAIVEPARQLGVEFEPGLVARIAAEATGQPSPLPLLQFTLSALFDRRDGRQLTTAAYEEIGGLTGALAARAESIYLEADNTQRGAIRRVFGRMTNPRAESADLRRRVPLTDLDEDPAASWVIERYGTARLLSFDRDDATREPTIEVAHEALLREWPRLVDWLAEDIDTLRVIDTIASAATTWEQGGRPPGDLYRGGRLENAVTLAITAPERLRSIETEFIDTSRHADEAERHNEQQRIRRLRRLVTGTAIALVIALVAGGLAFRSQQRADDEAANAVAQQAVAEEQTQAAVEAAENAAAATDRAELATLISQSGAVAADDEELSILLALEAHRRQPGPDTEQAVLRALASSTLANRVSSLGPPPNASPPDCAPLTITVYAGAATEFVHRGDGELISRDTVTGEIAEHGPAPGPCVNWLGDPSADRRIAYSPEGKLWLGTFDGPWNVEREFGHPIGVAARSAFNPGHRLLFLSTQDDGEVAMVVDDTTGETVGAPIGGPGEPTRGAVSPDGAFIAIGFDGGSGGAAGVILVVDGETGAELHRTPGITAAGFAFDEVSKELLVRADDRSVATIDLDTGEVIARVRTSATSDLLDVGVRSDGSVVVASTNQIEVIDRRTGPTGDTTAIPDSSVAELRADGRLFTVNAVQTAVETYDLGAAALIEQTIDLFGPSQAMFRSGSVVVTDTETSEVESIDLASGDRVDVPLLTPEGDIFEAVVVQGDASGFVAISADAQIARWEDGVMVERITPAVDSGERFIGRDFGEGVLGVGTELDGEPFQTYLINTNPGELELLAAISNDDAVGAVHRTGGGIHVLTSDGTMRTYDQTGMLTGELDTGLRHEPGTARTQAESDELVAFGGSTGAVFVDPATGEVTRLPDLQDAVTSVEFAQDGALLIVASADGSVRTWDVEKNISRGVIWRGNTAINFGTWYDKETDSLWIAEPERLIKLPLNPEVFLERACEVVDRDLTQDEWDRYIPGDEPPQSACG